MELTYIVNYENSGPAVDTTGFPNTNSGHFWTSTAYAADTDNGHYIDFDTGKMGNEVKTTNNYVRCVRGASNSLSTRFVDNSDSTITDKRTGLMWEQTESSQVNWESAISDCEGLSLGSQTDWRLPTIKELKSIADDTDGTAPMIDTTFFSSASSAGYWSSTTNSAFSTEAFDYNYSDNSIETTTKTSETLYVRCVRSGS
ncbi:MAG: DUF1566 domain-containing protein, partial [Planctomycetes bacterium]|nr:DUF1566 domain-containing protein [Planctomycetota bacterium]